MPFCFRTDIGKINCLDGYDLSVSKPWSNYFPKSILITLDSLSANGKTNLSLVIDIFLLVKII